MKKLLSIAIMLCLTTSLRAQTVCDSVAIAAHETSLSDVALTDEQLFDIQYLTYLSEHIEEAVDVVELKKYRRNSILGISLIVTLVTGMILLDYSP
mgnify:CR=1 FL=1